MKMHLLWLLILLGGSYTIAQPIERMTYLKANFCSAFYYSGESEEFIKKRLMNLKGEIRTIEQYHYVLVSDGKGSKVERLERGPYTFGYEFNNEHKIVMSWTFSSPGIRTSEIKYRNFKNQLRLSSNQTNGDTLIQPSAQDSWTSYYVNDELVKQEFKIYGIKRLFIKTPEGGFERRTWVKGVFQELEKYDNNDNLVRLIGHQLNNDLKTVQIHEAVHRYDKNFNKISIEGFSTNGTDTLTKSKWLYEYNNKGMMLNEYLFNPKSGDKELRETYTYNDAGDWITSREHLVDYVHEYRYDSQGNWIEHKVFEKENFKELRHVATMRRAIEYY